MTITGNELITDENQRFFLPSIQKISPASTDAGNVHAVLDGVTVKICDQAADFATTYATLIAARRVQSSDAIPYASLSSDVVLPSTALGLSIGGGGTLIVITLAGNTRTFTVPDGYFFPTAVKTIKNGTTCTNIIAHL